MSRTPLPRPLNSLLSRPAREGALSLFAAFLFFALWGAAFPRNAETKEPERPDLEASDGGRVSTEGNRLRLTTGPIKNVGSGDAEPYYKIKVYASSFNSAVSESRDTLIYTYTVPTSLVAGRSREITIENIPLDGLDEGKRYYFGWVVADVKGEIVTQNNSARHVFSEETPTHPDLATDERESSITMENGRFTLETGPVRNLGSAYAESGYIVRVYASTDPALTRDPNRLLKEATINASVAPGMFLNLKIQNIPTTGLKPGEKYYISWIISNVRNEIATENNAARTRDRIKVAASADLAASNGGSIRPEKNRFSLTTGTIKNVGSLRAESPYTINVYASTDNVISPKNDILLKSYKSYSSVQPGQSTFVSISDIPTAKLAEGKSYTIGWVIGDVRGEDSLDNNAAYCDSRLKIAASPDLEAQNGGSVSKNWNKFNLRTGQIKNVGTGPVSGTYTVRVYASEDRSFPDYRKIFLKEERISTSIHPGSSVTLTVDGIPSDKLTMNKEYYIGWTISDVRDEVETNNNSAFCDSRVRR
ncbi:MAG: hypothetical protein J6S40_10220 [Thermoguttaceae bacterium]|nr:hypothetical protein [Thermoguttaceae bacterium]